MQPTYVRITIKKRHVFQFVFPDDEISPDISCAKRSETTGNLLLDMPRVNFKLDHCVLKSEKLEKAAPTKQTPITGLFSDCRGKHLDFNNDRNIGIDFHHSQQLDKHFDIPPLEYA